MCPKPVFMELFQSTFLLIESVSQPPTQTRSSLAIIPREGECGTEYFRLPVVFGCNQMTMMVQPILLINLALL